MQRISSLLLSQIFVLLVVGSYSYAWSRDDSELKRMYSAYASQLKRPQYDFGLGKRAFEEPESYEETYSGVGDSNTYNFPDKKAAPQSMYSFGLGKKNRAYGFGLGKRLDLLKYSSMPTNRQERRSKIYSFGLGKRAGLPEEEDNSNSNGMAMYNDEIKRANGGRQFSFGLGKREVSSSTANSS